MNNILKERAEILQSIIPELFKVPKHNPECAISKICVHLHICEYPNSISNLKSIKVSNQVEAIMDKYNTSISVLTKQSNLKCPLSQMEISDPWKGKCGHLFDKGSIKAYMKKDSYCPVHGCDKILKEDKKA